MLFGGATTPLPSSVVASRHEDARRRDHEPARVASDHQETAVVLPSPERHVHLEGTLEPELAFELAARHGTTFRSRTSTRCVAPTRSPFVDTATGATVLVSERQKAIRDRCTVTLPDPRLHFRVAASMAVARDASQSR